MSAADSYEDGRFVGLTVTAPSAVRQGGLLVDPKVALEQIEKDIKPKEGAKGDVADESTESGGSTGATGETATGATTNGGTTSTIPTRFQATKELTTNRVVRDVGQIYEEIISHFVTGGVPIRVSIDIESDQLDKLTEDKRTAIGENLKTLGFDDGNWSMD